MGVKAQEWVSWRSQALNDLSTGLEKLKELNADGVRLTAPVAHAFARAYVTGRMWMKEDVALRVAVQGCLAPYALATQQAEALAHVLEVAEIEIDEAELSIARRVLV
jgi:hypothetical protein